MTSVAIDCWAIFQQSAGDPRRAPSIASPTPRSSTHRPQFTQLRSEPRVRACKVLVHEITAWDDRRSVEETRTWGHTHVDELIAVAEQFEGDALVLVHRSPRHTRTQAEAVVRERFPAAVRDKVHVFGR